MTLEEIRSLARRYANANSTKFTDADLDESINNFQDEISGDIIGAMDGWDVFGETATANIVSGQQEYVTPDDAIWVKRAEITYDGTNWYPITWFDINERTDATDTTNIANDFHKEKPFADLHESSLFLYPIPDADVAGGLKMWYIKLPDELSETSDEPTFIRIFHKLLAYGAAKDFLEQYITEEGNDVRLRQCEKNIAIGIAKMKNIYNKHNQDRDYVVSTAFVDYGYGND